MENRVLLHGQGRPDALAMAMNGREVTYRELSWRAESCAYFLRERGIEAGTPVAIDGENSLAWVYLAHGLFWLGAQIVPLHRGATGEEKEAMVAASGAKTVFGEKELQGLGASLQGSLDESLQLGERVAPYQWRLEERVAVFFTSGSTGTPRGVPLSLDNLVSSAVASADRLGRNEEHHWLCPLALFHIGGYSILSRAAFWGTSFELLRSFETEEVWGHLESGKINGASFVPTMLHRLLKEGTGRVARGLDVVLIGGGPVNTADLLQARSQGIPVVPTYGMTESASQIATLAPGEGFEKLKSAGRPLRGAVIKVVDENQEFLPTGTTGRLVIGGPMVVSSYLGEETPKVENYFLTSDVGYIDDEGYLFIEHRLGERIVSGGKNIDPLEVEVWLRGSEWIEDALVSGVDDPEWGQKVVALVRPRKGKDWTREAQEQLQKEGRATLSKYKMPKFFFVVDEFPTTATGKIDRKAAQRLAESFCQKDL